MREDNICVKRCMTHKYCGQVCFAFVFACIVGKNQKTPKLSPMADDATTRGGIGGLGSLVYLA